MDISRHIDYKNIKGKVWKCIAPQYLSGAGKPLESRRQATKVNKYNMFVLGTAGKGVSADK